MTPTSSRSFGLLLAAFVLTSAVPSLAAVTLGRGLAGARAETEHSLIKGAERPVALKGLSGLRQQTRAALRPAKIENKSESRILMAVVTPRFAELKAVSHAQLASTRGASMSLGGLLRK